MVVVVFVGKRKAGQGAHPQEPDSVKLGRRHAAGSCHLLLLLLLLGEEKLLPAYVLHQQQQHVLVTVVQAQLRLSSLAE